MQFLPDTNIKCINTDEGDHNGQKSLSKMITLIEEYIGADCWALMIDGEIIFNSYNYNRTVKEVMTESMMCAHFISDVRTSLWDLMRMPQKSHCIRMFMFGENSWELRIEYDDDPLIQDQDFEYTVSFYKTTDTAWDFLVPV